MTSNRSTFMDYKAQIQHLKNKNLIIEDDNLAIHILSKIGYYGLINGYKEVFKNTTTNRYISNTHFIQKSKLKNKWKKCIPTGKTSFIIIL